MSLSYSSIISKAHYHNFEFKLLKKKLKNAYKEGATFLDVGFGLGKYLDLAKETGYRTFGIEINESYIEKANQKGYSCYLLDDLLKLNQKFDVIMMSHIIEHLTTEQLISNFEIYLRLLKDDGQIIVASPVIGDRFYYDITHTRAYYPQSIWHVFGTNSEELSVDRTQQRVVLDDIYYLRDSFRTRETRSYYINDGTGLLYRLTRIWNYILASVYLLSGARIGKKASWVAFYKKRKD